jgi:hypothetical protein
VAALVKPIFPAYGRELMRRRLAGHHPDADELVLVAFNFWPQFGDAPPYWPRFRAVIIFDDMLLARLELRMLAGATLLVGFDRAHQDRAIALLPFLWAISPSRILLLDYETKMFFEDTGSEILNRTEDQLSYWWPLAADLARYAARPKGNDARAA